MGKSSAETVREIEATRTRLDQDLQELQARLPAPAVWTKRLVGVAVGGGAAGSAFWFVVRRLKKRREKKHEAERIQAVVQVLPDEWARTVAAAMEDGRWKPWAAGAAGLWLLLRLAEVRQLRRMNRLAMARVAG